MTRPTASSHAPAPRALPTSPARRRVRTTAYSVPTGSGVAARLQCEWDRLRHRRHVVEHARAWAVTDEPFDDLDRLLALAGFRTTASGDTEVVLRQLVLLAAHDELAARVVLQRVLPGLMAVVRSRHARSGDDVLEHLVAAVWIAIRTFSSRRRPACLAAALIEEAERACYCRPGRRRATTELTLDPERASEMADQRRPSPCEELAEVLADARAAGVTAADLDLVRRLLQSGSTVQVARDLDVTARTVRNRRERLTNQLRLAALAA